MIAANRVWARAGSGTRAVMQGESTHDDERFDAELAELLRRAEEERRPDRRGPRGRQPPVEEPVLERGRDDLERVLGF